MALTGLLASAGNSTPPASGGSNLKGLLATAGQPTPPASGPINQNIPSPEMTDSPGSGSPDISLAAANIAKSVASQGAITFDNTKSILAQGPGASIAPNLKLASAQSAASDAEKDSQGENSPLGETANYGSAIAQNFLNAPATLGSLIKSIWNQEASPSQEETSAVDDNLPGGKQLIGTSPSALSNVSQDLAIPAKVFSRFFQPFLQGAGQNIADSILANSSKARSAYGLTPDDIATLPSAQESVMQGVGNFMQLAFAIATPEIGAKLGISGASESTMLDIYRAAASKPISESFSPLAKIVGKSAAASALHGGEAGTYFGIAQALSAGQTDPKQIAQTVFKTALGMAMLGALTGSAGTAKDAATVSLLKNVKSNLGVPTHVYVDAKTIDDYVNTGKITDGQAKDLFDQLGGLGELQRQAKEQGTSVNKLRQTGGNFSITPEEVLEITDKPYWAAIKGAFGVRPSSSIVIPGKAQLSERLGLPSPAASSLKDEVADNLSRNHQPDQISKEVQKQFQVPRAAADQTVKETQAEMGQGAPGAAPKTDPIHAAIAMETAARTLKEAETAETPAKEETKPVEANKAPTIEENAKDLPKEIRDAISSYKTPEDFKKALVESTWGPYKGIPMNVPVDKLKGQEPTNANSTITGHRDVTEPVEVIYDPADKEFKLLDGNHRAAQARANGDKTVPAIVGLSYDTLDKDGDVTGMEDFLDAPEKLHQALAKDENKIPKTPEETAQRYYDEKIAPAIKEGKAVVIGADDMKDHFKDAEGKGDYVDARHSIYSKASFSLYERALKEVKDPEVVLLGGGPGSGKTELVTKRITDAGFAGVVYDSNLANYDGAVKQIEAAKAAGKDVHIYGVTPDLAHARGYTVSRETSTGRGVSDSAFARGHIGFPDVVAKLIENGVIAADHVHILDTRNIHTKEEALGAKYQEDPLAHVKSLGYDEEHVKASFTKESVAERDREATDSRESNGEVPAKNGTDKGGQKESDETGSDVQQVEEFEGFKDISTTVLDKLVGRRTVSKTFISELTNSSDLKAAEKNLIRNLLKEEPAKVNVKAFAEKVRTELLPLAVVSEVPDFIQDRYEKIRLPVKMSGDVSQYQEKIYESPIPTSAGEIHFSDASQNYFAHTRTEDLAASGSKSNRETKRIEEDFQGEPGFTMVDSETNKSNPEGMRNGIFETREEAEKALSEYKDGNTRRVIELQSDLFQKDGIQSELPNTVSIEVGGRKFDVNRNRFGVDDKTPKKFTDFDVASPNAKSRTGFMSGNGVSVSLSYEDAKDKAITADEAKDAVKKAQEVYDARAEELKKLEPYRNTWHERIIREEIRQAAIDDKTELQFPTGETAMKIEGLSDPDHFMVTDAQGVYNLTPDDIQIGLSIHDRAMNLWTITDDLGDGKFKAVLKTTSDAYKDAPDNGPTQDAFESLKETFDISGKVDTNNPIYKFYENEVGKYLKSKYGAEKITDPRGVTWWQVHVPEEAATKPVGAFSESPVPKPKARPRNTQGGFINPGAIAGDIAETAAKINELAEANAKSFEMSEDKAMDMYKLRGEQQADIETAYQALETAPIESGDDTAIYHKLEEPLNPREARADLTPSQQAYKEAVIDPLIKLTDAADKIIDDSGLPGMEGSGYISRFAKDKDTIGDRLFNPQENEKPYLQTGSLLRKTDSSDKARTMRVLIDEATGQRTIVSVKNHEYTIEEGVRKGDTIRSKRVTAFKKGEEPVDMGRFDLKTKDQLKKSEITPIQKKIDTVQKQIDALNRIKVQDPVGAAKTARLEKSIADLIEYIDSNVGAFTHAELKSDIKSLRAQEAKLATLKTVKPADKLTNVEEQLNDLQDVMRQLTNRMADIEAKYNENEMNGKVFKANNGKTYRIGDATTLEIEANSQVKYWKSATVSVLAHALSRMKIARGITMMNAWKDAPDADLIFQKDDKPAPIGWGKSDWPQFRGYFVEPRTLAVLDDFYHELQRSPEAIDSILSKTNRMLTHAVFFSPVVHPVNTASTWFVDQGANWINPLAWKTSASSMAKAIEAIRTKNKDYMDAMRGGVPFQASLIGSDQLGELIRKKIGSDLDITEDNSTLAKRLGFDTVMALKNAIGRAWHTAAFKAGDVFFLQAVYQRQMETGMSFADAMKDTSRFIPDYRIPSTFTLPTKYGKAIGTRALPKTLVSGSGIFLASRYHVGLIKAIGAIAGDIAAPKEGYNAQGARTAGRALAKAAMLALATYYLMHQGKKIVEWMTGNPLAYPAGGGDIKLAVDFVRLLHGDSSPDSFVGSLMPFAPLALGVAEVAINRDSFTGDPIYGAPNAIGFGAFGESLLAPLQSAAEYTPSAFLWSWLAIHDPSTPMAKVRFESLAYDVKPGLEKQVETDILNGNNDLAVAQMKDFNQQIVSNYQQALIEEGQPPLTQGQINAIVSKYGIKAPGSVAMANATQAYNDNQIVNKSKLLDTVISYAQALGTDPVTAFNRIFTGQRIVSVDNPGFLNPDGAVIVQRLPLAASEAIREEDAQAQGISEAQLKGMQLDHVIALELGGTNDKSNLNLISANQNEKENPIVENFLARALKAGDISRANVNEYIIRYKAGALGETLPQSFMDQYEKDYGSEPLTAQQIFDLVNSGKAK